MSDDHYRTGPGYNAFGSELAPNRDVACRDIYVGAGTSVFECALVGGHDGMHETAGGTSW